VNVDCILILAAMAAQVDEASNIRRLVRKCILYRVSQLFVFLRWYAVLVLPVERISIFKYEYGTDLEVK
jgi:hypothetical protein